MLAGAAMAAIPAFAAPRASVASGTPASGFRTALGGTRVAVARPGAVRRPTPRSAPVVTRAGEALDWENDDFVPASKANKKKKSKGGNKAQAKKQKADKVPPAPAAEALDWENDDFVPAGKAKKNKKKPKKNNAEAAPEEPAQAPTAAADALDWENDDFVPTGKAKNKKKPKKQAAAAMAPEAPVIDGGLAAEEAEAVAAANAETCYQSLWYFMRANVLGSI